MAKYWSSKNVFGAAVTMSSDLTVSGNVSIGGTLVVTNTTTLSGALLLPNGTAAAPALAFASSGNDNSGVYLIGADNPGLSINGTLSLSFLADTIKFGSSSDLSLLRTAANTLQLGINAADNSAVTQTIQSATSTTDVAGAKLAIQAQKGSGTTYAPLLLNPSGGNVGIGTTVPQSLLDVQGPTGTGAAAAGILTLATKELTIVDDDQLGRINFNAPLESDGSDAILAGAAIWAEAEATFSATVNNTALVFGTATTSAAVERMRIDASGSVGIGTTGPNRKLELYQADSSNALLRLSSKDSVAGSPYEAAMEFYGSTTNDVTNVFQAGRIYGVYDSSGYDTARLTLQSVNAAGSFVDTLSIKNGNVGIGTAAPAYFTELQKAGTATATTDILGLTNSGNAASMTSTGTAILFNQWYYDATTPAVADAGRIAVLTEGNWTSTGTTQDASMIFQVALDGTVGTALTLASNKSATFVGTVSLLTGQKIEVGSTAVRATAAGTNLINVFDGTAPEGTLANGISIYSASGEGYMMDAAGNATLQTPHDRLTNEWIFYSKNTRTGQVLRIDMERLLRRLDAEYGGGYIHEFNELLVGRN